jgi:hypothetical protein
MAFRHGTVGRTSAVAGPWLPSPPAMLIRRLQDVKRMTKFVVIHHTEIIKIDMNFRWLVLNIISLHHIRLLSKDNDDSDDNVI